MTNEEIDKLIATRIMGWVDAPNPYGDGTQREWRDPTKIDEHQGFVHHARDWRPSVSMNQAMQAAEIAATAPHWLGVTVSTFGIPHAKCYRDSKQVAEAWIELDDIPDTRPLSARCARALCLALLQAVGVQV